MKKFLQNILIVSGIIAFFLCIWTLLTPEAGRDNSISSAMTVDTSERQFVADALKEQETKINVQVSALLSEIEEIRQFYLLKLAEAVQKFGAESKEVRELCEFKNEQDKIHLKTVKGIIDKYGWLGEKRIGAQNSYTLFAVIQDADFETQKMMTTVMEQAVHEGTLSPQYFARFIDRRALVQHSVQIYGTQLNKDENGNFKFAPIIEEDKVNQRRLEIGLAPLEQYAFENNVAWAKGKDENS